MRPGFYFLMYSSFEFHPIGFVRSCGKYRFEAPRQGVFNGIDGVVELLPEYGGDAIADLAGFDRIWIIFCFHLNLEHPWKPKVRPPFPAGGACRSLFATRSPYRVNPLGLSCVKLDSVERNRILFSGADMLDGTPVLDIKPYIPEADAFPAAAAGWRDRLRAEEYKITYAPEFIAKAEFLLGCGAPDMQNVALVQLTHQPFDSKRKRLYPGRKKGCTELGCRTWRIEFCEIAPGELLVKELYSNYAAKELLPECDDPYQDKELHRKFMTRFYPDNAENT